MIAESADLKFDSGVSAGAVFDRLAASYDQDFTNSLIGRAQREIVWKVLLQNFQRNDNILELNCGTGEDAFFLADNGISVFSCDASEQMISQAERRLQRMPFKPPITFCHLPTERIAELGPDLSFDGAFSNFSGLNCIADLAPTAANLANLVKPEGSLVLCLSTRFCLSEMLFYLSQGRFRKAIRRCSGSSQATLDGASLTVFYPTLRQLRRSFSPYFRLRSVQGVGVVVPPSYLEAWVSCHPSILRLLCRLEPLLASLPVLRGLGDHVLLRFEKVSP